MAVDYFDYALAIDPSAGIVIPNATAQVYDPADTSFDTPLAITDITGASLSQIKASPTGVFPPFKVVSGATQVFARTPAGVVTPLTSVFGMHGAAAAASAADAAASAAAATAAAAQAEIAAANAPGLPPGGTTGQVLAKNSNVDRDVTWITPSGGGGSGLINYSQIIALPGYPTSFAPSAHSHTASQISDATAVGRAVMNAVDAQAARAAIGAGTGNGTSNLTLGTSSTQAAAGNHTHPASGITFTPIGSITATNVQNAIEQAAASGGGGSGGSSVLIWRYGSGAYPSLPAVKPAGVELVIAYGPVAPSSVPSWIGTDVGDALGQYEYMALT